MTERVIPFAMDFQEEIPQDDTLQVKGDYNNETQTWKWPTDPDDPSLIMSFPREEKPPTTCIRPTQITKDRTRADTVVDD